MPSVERTKYAAYLLCASIMNAPAAIVLSKMVLPEIKPRGCLHLVNLSKP